MIHLKKYHMIAIQITSDSISLNRMVIFFLVRTDSNLRLVFIIYEILMLFSDIQF